MLVGLEEMVAKKSLPLDEVEGEEEMAGRRPWSVAMACDVEEVEEDVEATGKSCSEVLATSSELSSTDASAEGLWSTGCASSDSTAAEAASG